MKHTVSLKQNHEFRRLYNRGATAVTGTMALYCRKNRLGVSRLGLTTGVKLGGAVVRNRIRRRLREIYRTNEDKLGRGWDLVIVARKRAAFASYAEMERGFLSLAGKLGILEERG